MSPPHFARVFAARARDHAGPLRGALRVEAARRRLEESEAGVEAVAPGLRLRHAPRRCVGVPASAARGARPIPSPFGPHRRTGEDVRA